MAGLVRSRPLLMVAIGVATAACREHETALVGGATPEEAVRSALERAVHKADPAPFVLDASRCHALYAGNDVPGGEAECASSATVLLDALRGLDATVTFDIGARTTDRFGRVAFSITLHHAGVTELKELCAVRVEGRYFACAKIDTTPPSAFVSMTVAELHRAIIDNAPSPRTGDFVSLDARYMAADGDERIYLVDLVEDDAGTNDATFRVGCDASEFAPNVKPGQHVQAKGVLERRKDRPVLKACTVTWTP